MSALSRGKIDYHQYINSEEWRSKHPGFLAAANYQCSAFPWVTVGKAAKKRSQPTKRDLYSSWLTVGKAGVKSGSSTTKEPYRCHHLHYKNLGNEMYWRDVLCLCPFAHDVIIHKWLSGGKRPKDQDVYPNRSQKLFHAYCRLPVPAKYCVIAALFGLAGYLSSGVLGMVLAVLVVVFVLR